MELWISCILLLLSICGIALSAWKTQGTTRRTSFRIIIAILEVIAAASALYIAATVFFLNSIN